MAKLEIKVIDSVAFGAIMDSEKNGTYSPFGLFLIEERPDLFIACDNSTGDAWTEEFCTREDAENFLNGEDMPESEDLLEDYEDDEVYFDID